MPVLALKIRIADKGVVKTMQFEPSTQVFDACKIIREKLPEANLGQAKDYGLFLSDEDPRKGVWMENGRNLEYYLVRSGDCLEYKKKIRTLRVRMLDGAVKTLLVDDSQPLGQLMVVICTRIGITNHEEYSLVREHARELEKPSTPSAIKREEGRMGTLTLGRSKEKKMEQLRKQLHTDEETNWVDHSKTLREQGIDESETLLLRRKYFFSDQNIDSRDPVQLNLLYVQCRDGVLDGTHPVTLDEALILAGLQCQIQFGDFLDTKHRTGFLDMKEFLPAEYLRVKNAEKRVLAEHGTNKGMREADAKVKYTARCRSLKTYGVTFFLVKEKLKGKNKLVARLLGINKDCVMRVDEKTKEVLRIWPLEQVRRWAASPNTFTLDFGDYQDGYYSMQTPDGEKIAQLIAGYIDIILKKKKAKDHYGIEGDDGAALYEDTVSPAKMTLMTHGKIPEARAEESFIALPGVMRPGLNGEVPYGTGSMGKPLYGAIGGQVTSTYMPPQGQQPRLIDTVGKAQRALLGTIKKAEVAIEKAEEELLVKEAPVPVGQDQAAIQWKIEILEVNKQKVESQLAAMGAATAEVVHLTGAIPDEVDHTAVGAAISTISSNIPEVTRGVKTIASLMDEEDKGDKLIDATRKMCNAFSDLLKAVNPEKPAPLITVLEAAGRVGAMQHAMIESIEEPTDEAKEFQDVLVQLAKAVATSTAHLVTKTKVVSSQFEEPALQERIIHYATQCAFATSQLVACAKVVAPTIDSPACQQQLTEACRQVAKAVENLLKDAELSCAEIEEDHAIGDLREAAKRVTNSLSDLLRHIKDGPRRARVTAHGQQLDTIITTTDRIISESGTSNEMIRRTKIVAEATTEMITKIKGEAEIQEDRDDHNRLMDAARHLADTTTRMIAAAKLCASSPQEPQHQEALKAAADDLRSATKEAAHDQLKDKAVIRLEIAAKNVASGATQTIAAANTTEPSNKNMQSMQDLMDACQDTAKNIPKVISAVKQHQQHPEDSVSEFMLIQSSKDLLTPSDQLVARGKSAIPTVEDQAASMRLSTTVHQLSEYVAELRTAVNQAQDACGPMQLDTAMMLVESLEEELVEYHNLASQGRLVPLPGDSAEKSALQLNGSSKMVGTSMAQLLSAAAQNDHEHVDYTARDTAEGLRNLTHSVRGIVATDGSAPKERLIEAARDVMDKSVQLLKEVKYCRNHPDGLDNQQRLAQVAKAATYSLNKCVNCLPGQQGIDSAIEVITTTIKSISLDQMPGSSRSYQDVQEDFVKSASILTDATNRLTAASGGPGHLLAEAVQHYIVVFKQFIYLGLELAYLTEDEQVREQIVEALRSLSQQSGRLLVSLKASTSDPSSASLKQQLTSAARAVTESINRLIDICTSGAPWQKECDNALRNIEAMRQLLTKPVEPINDYSYYECLDVINDRSKSLGDGMTGIKQHAENAELDGFCMSVRDVATAFCGLAEAAAQAAYLIGASDMSSVHGRTGVVDQNKMGKAIDAVKESCFMLQSPSITEKQVLESATVIARQTGILANVCYDASSRSTNPTAKKHFINCARDVASCTAELIRAIKTLDSDFTVNNKKECAQATVPLLSAVDALAAFSGSAEFASVPAKISQQGRRAQQPIIGAGTKMLDGSVHIIQTAKSLAFNPRDPPTWQILSNESKIVSDAIKSLITAIRDRAPGQMECEQGIARLEVIIQQLDHVSMEASNQTLEPRRETTEQGFHEQLSNSAQQIATKIDTLSVAAKREAESLGHRVSDVMNFFDPLSGSCIGAASHNYSSRQQMALLFQCKTVCECMLQLLANARDCGGNPKAVQFHKGIDESAGSLHDALDDLVQTLSQATAEIGILSTTVEAISRAIAKTDEAVSVEDLSFVDYQTRMVASCKEIARIATEMVSKTHTSPNELGQLALDLSKHYEDLASDTRGAVAAVAGSESAGRIRSSVQELGTACIELIKNAATVRSNPSDNFAKRDVSESSRVVSEKVAYVLAALRSSSRGTQACITAASTVSGIIGDLDTTIMFATAGTLNPEMEGDVFSDHREAILKTAKALVEDTKALVAGAASSQEQLAVAAQNAVKTIIGLSDVVKSGAAALTSQNSEAQVLVINAVKDVAAALANLIQATKNASGKSFNDPAMIYLKEAAKVMVTNVTSLLKTVKTVEDEHQRGTRALEAAIEAIAQEIRAYDATETTSTSANPEDLIRVTKPIAEATAKSVAAGKSTQQEDVIVAANLGRKVVADLLATCKATANNAETADAKYRALDSGRDVAIKVRELLQCLHLVLQKPTQDSKQLMVPASRAIAQAVTDLVAYAEILKGSDWVDPSDPTVIAENELLGAANSIEAAARKLAQLKPRPLGGREADESLNFDEQILEAAKSIAAAVAALVKAASAAQRELVDQGRIDPRPKFQSDDYQWSEGLISAARLVAVATHQLCEAANNLVQGLATEEKLISAANQVAASTAQLLIACKVKADMNSKGMQRLQAAGNAVKTAADHLVRAAKQAIEAEDDRTLIINQRMVSGMAQVLDAQETVLKKEKELNDARVTLANIRRAKYQEHPAGGSPEPNPYYSDF